MQDFKAVIPVVFSRYKPLPMNQRKDLAFIGVETCLMLMNVQVAEDFASKNCKIWDFLCYELIFMALHLSSF